MAEHATLPLIAPHGASRLPAVEVGSYNVAITDDEGFLADRASKSAFRAIVENRRRPCARSARTRSATTTPRS